MLNFYAITPDNLDFNELMLRVEGALRGGINCLQYRSYSTNRNKKLKTAYHLQKKCQKFGIPLIINNDCSLAKEVGAAGVHLGQNDTPVVIARRFLGEKAIIGVSCQNSILTALSMATAGANYLSMGAIYPSLTKKDTSNCSLNVLRVAKRRLSIPILAIGGITTFNVGPVLETGVDGIAVSEGLLGQTQTETLSRHWINIIENRKK